MLDFAAVAEIQIRKEPAMMSSISILVINREPLYRDMLAASISRFGARPFCCGSLESAADLLGEHPIHIVFCDDVLPDGTFQTLMDSAEICGMQAAVIVTSRRDEWGPFLQALSAGVFDYIALPPVPGEVDRILSAAIRASRTLPRAVAQMPADEVTGIVC
jgi:DNA-binding NtrC family response regulator